MSVALDATGLIYAVNQTARRAEEQAACSRVYDFVLHLQRVEREEIQVPAPALAEFLAFYPDADRRKQAADVIDRGFVVTDFDFRAAVQAAEVWEKLGGPRAFRQAMKAGFDISKQCVKTDIQIVATAVSHGAARIIADDKGVIQAAKAFGLSVLTPGDCVAPVAPASGRLSLFDAASELPPPPALPPS